MTSARIAIYFAPKQSTPLYQFGQQILGRTEHDPTQRYGDVLFESTLRPKPKFLEDLTKPAAFYGFHATLKAPFSLRPDKSVEGLKRDLSAFASRTLAIPMQGLMPSAYRGFSALCFADHPQAISDLAKRCVIEFDAYRAPLTDAEVAARVISRSLDDAQRARLETYGYPHVLDFFNFHMTLSGRLSDDQEHASFLAWTKELYAELVPVTPVLDQLTLWHQASQDQPFTQIESYSLKSD